MVSQLSQQIALHQPATSPDGGLLLDPATDLWADWGLLGVPDPSQQDTGAATTPSFRSFIEAAYPGYGFHRWAERLIALLQQVADGQLSRLIVCCPPRLGKSLLVSKLFPAYWVSRYPDRFCAIASYSAELAYAHSREARHYYRSCGYSLSKDSTAVGNWLTPQRGGCIAAGVRGPFTGKGYALGIIDDPYKGPEDANSASQRQKLIEWFQSVWLTRAEPAPAPEGPLRWGVAGEGGADPEIALASSLGTGSDSRGVDCEGHSLNHSAAQVVVLTRWHQDDLIGWLLDQEGGEAPQHWHVLNLPAIAEPPEQQLCFPPTCTLEADWREPGEPLCPERFPIGELQQVRSRIGSYWWNALYQQRPSPAEGLLFQRAWLQPPLPTAPGQTRRYSPLVLSCDLSFKGGAQNDACGFVLLGLVEPQLIPAMDARRQGFQLAANVAAARGLNTGQASAKGSPVDPWAELQIEVLWSQRQQLDLPGVIKVLLASLDALERQGLRPHAVLIEDTANGPAVCQLLQRQVPGLIAIPPKGSKASRAHAVAPLLEAGQVRFATKAQSLMDELLAFSPTSGVDDQVDAFCQGVLWIEAQYWRSRGSGRAPVPMLFSR